GAVHFWRRADGECSICAERGSLAGYGALWRRRRCDLPGDAERPADSDECTGRSDFYRARFDQCIWRAEQVDCRLFRSEYGYVAGGCRYHSSEHSSGVCFAAAGDDRQLDHAAHCGEWGGEFPGDAVNGCADEPDAGGCSADCHTTGDGTDAADGTGVTVCADGFGKPLRQAAVMGQVISTGREISHNEIYTGFTRLPCSNRSVFCGMRRAARG